MTAAHASRCSLRLTGRTGVAGELTWTEPCSVTDPTCMPQAGSNAAPPAITLASGSTHANQVSQLSEGAGAEPRWEDDARIV
jgi:hypothetical protein